MDLLAAVEEGDLPKVKTLIKRGADIDFREGVYLRMAIYNNRPETFAYLIKEGANIHNNFSLNDAVDCAQLNIMECLIQLGADVHSNAGYSLHWAKENKFHDVSKCLLKCC